MAMPALRSRSLTANYPPALILDGRHAQRVLQTPAADGFVRLPGVIPLLETVWVTIIDPLEATISQGPPEDPLRNVIVSVDFAEPHPAEWADEIRARRCCTVLLADHPVDLDQDDATIWAFAWVAAVGLVAHLGPSGVTM